MTNHQGGEVHNTSYADSIPSDKRGYIHAVVGAVFVLLMSFAFLNDSQVSMYAAITLAVADLILVLVYTKNKWRQALYPLLYLVGGALATVGVLNEVQATAIVGLAVTVLGTQFAAAKTPVASSV